MRAQATLRSLRDQGRGLVIDRTFALRPAAATKPGAAAASAASGLLVDVHVVGMVEIPLDRQRVGRHAAGPPRANHHDLVTTTHLTVDKARPLATARLAAGRLTAHDEREIDCPRCDL
jgi:hypothetical protein